MFDWGESGGMENKALPGLCTVWENGRKNDWAQTFLIQVEVKNWVVTTKRIEIEYITSKAATAK